MRIKSHAAYTLVIFITIMTGGYAFFYLVSDALAQRFLQASTATVNIDVSFALTKLREKTDLTLSPIITDLNNDGQYEPFGTRRQNGQFVPLPLSDILNHWNTDWPRIASTHLADYNGDGFTDFLYTTYADEKSEGSHQMLFMNDGRGGFVENTSFSSLQISGFAETALSADFDNDGDLDIYIPMYTFHNTEEQSYLLINDGKAGFTDQADTAGVAMRNWPYWLRPEGAQAVDFNADGWIDIYTASHFFVNNGNGTFTDKREQMKLPLLPDEGLKFLDWNNDGYLDVVSVYKKIHLFEYRPSSQLFVDRSFVIPQTGVSAINDLNVADFNNDGFEDLLVGKIVKDYPWPVDELRPVISLFMDMPPQKIASGKILINRSGKTFQWSSQTFDIETEESLRSSIGDLNVDGLPDMTLVNDAGEVYLATNTTTSYSPYSFGLDVVGPNGEKTQQGRIVRITPTNHPDVTYTRAVDSGSGYRTQNQYSLFTGTPYNEPHTVTVQLDSGPETLTILSGEHKTIHAKKSTSLK